MPANSNRPTRTKTAATTTTPNPTHLTGWVVALVAFAVAIAGATWLTIDRGQNQSPSWLFSHTATAGSLLQKSDVTYTLTLTGIDPHVMAFTDRPERDSVILPAAELIKQWPTLFKSSPPNAVLVEHTSSGDTDSVVLTLTNPRLTTPAGTKPAKPTLIFDATLIAAEHPANLKRLTHGIHKTTPDTFANASLFIDDVAWVPPPLPFPPATETWSCATLPNSPQTFIAGSDAAFDFQVACMESGGVPQLVF